MNYNTARSLRHPTFLKREEGYVGREAELVRESKRNESERRGDGESVARGGGGKRRGCFARECATQEGDERGWGRSLRGRLSPRTREFKMDMLISLGIRGRRFTDTFIPFKEMLPRVDSSALNDELPPARRIYGGWSHGLWSIENFSPSGFLPYVDASRSHPFSSLPILPSRARKKSAVFFLLSSRCLPSSPLHPAIDPLLKSNMFWIASRFAFLSFFSS